MMKQPIEHNIKDILHYKLLEIEKHLNTDIFVYYGPIVNGHENTVLRIIEDLIDEKNRRETLSVILTTTGGSAYAVERYVNIFRKHYKEVNFIVPDYAFSAGTIFCMSGDKIYMDYFSVLGPIDPQVQSKDGKWVAALGYLDKINELIKKAQDKSLTDAEFIILKEFDLAELRGYEQAKELTISLLKKWLVVYKFKNWDVHQTNVKLKGKKVTISEKEARAEEIANKLSDNNIWKSHGRPINIETLEKELRLQIEDFSSDKFMRPLVRSYYELMSDFIHKNNINIFVQTRKFI